MCVGGAPCHHCPGHATILTGALARSQHVPINDWYDRATDKPVYCVEDANHHWIGAQEKEGEGTGPQNLTTTTLGDEWLLATRSRARVISISLKDRGSILLGGRLGKAFWFDERTGRFIGVVIHRTGGFGDSPQVVQIFHVD